MSGGKTAALVEVRKRIGKSTFLGYLNQNSGLTFRFE